MLNGKDKIIGLIVGLTKGNSINEWIFSKTESRIKSKEKVKVELDLSNYATKTDSKNATGIDTSSFAKKVDLANLKSNVDELDIDKLKNLATNLSNLKSKVHQLDVEN